MPLVWIYSIHGFIITCVTYVRFWIFCKSVDYWIAGHFWYETNFLDEFDANGWDVDESFDMLVDKVTLLQKLRIHKIQGWLYSQISGEV